MKSKMGKTKNLRTTKLKNETKTNVSVRIFQTRSKNNEFLSKFSNSYVVIREVDVFCIAG